MGIKQGVYRKLGGLGELGELGGLRELREMREMRERGGLGELGVLGDSHHTKQQAGHPVVGWPAGCYE